MGLPPKYLEKLLGKKIVKNVIRGEAVNLEHVE